MKILFRRWRALPVALAVAASTLAMHAAVQVKTLGGGPNQTSPARSGSANGDTLRQAKFNNPSSIAIDTNGNLYIADQSNNKVRKITKPGSADSLTSTFASRLPGAIGVAVDSSNFVYVVTQNDGRLRVFTSGGTLVRTVSGLVKPTALALDENGNVYVAELVGNVKVIAPDDSVNLVTSGFNKLRGIAVLPNGLLAVSESGNNAIHTIDPNDGSAILIAGGNARGGFADGIGVSAQFNQPYGIGAAPNGAIIIADRLNHRVRMIDSNNLVTTLYGIDRRQWSPGFPGWADGPGGETGTAEAREPLGLTVARNGTVYVGEGFWDLIRQATGLFGTNTTGTGTGTNGTNVTVTGTNVISFGFESGEGSSDFVGAAGQSFYAPVTLTVAREQKIYSLQMSLSATGETGVALSPLSSAFVSMVMQEKKTITTNLQNGPGGQIIETLVTNVTGYVPIDLNYSVRNSSINLLSVGWIERYLQTNLYNTLAQDLITYSIAKDTLFGSDRGQVILGAYRMAIPSSAGEADAFRISLTRPSATPENWTQDVPLSAPINGSLGAGAVNTIKQIRIASRPYIVGDTVPFRWFNAGDFGEGLLLNNDVIQVFESAEEDGSAQSGYNQNRPIGDSDLFDAMDSSNGADSPFCAACGDDATINSRTIGDGRLRVDDVYVTFRRALDPTLKWFARYWSNGVRNVIEVPNTAKAGASSAPKFALVGGRKSVVARPAAQVSVGDSSAAAGVTIDLPVQIQISNDDPVRVMMLNVSVEALDGSPAMVQPIRFQTAPTFRTPELSNSKGANNYAAAWLDPSINGVSGNAVLGILTVRVPTDAGSRSAYRVTFNHFSASPNGLSLFESHAIKGLLLLSDRSASTWNDGIADAWRLRHFGSIYAPESAPGADADGDGVINSIEYENGTDPANSTSN